MHYKDLLELLPLETITLLKNRVICISVPKCILKKSIGKHGEKKRKNPTECTLKTF